MSGLELPAFIIGLGGLASIFDHCFLIWRTIRQAQDFSEDIADWMRKLEMEFFHFQTWWTALEYLSQATNTCRSMWPARQQAPAPTLSSMTSPLVLQLRDHVGHPITNAASSVLKLLEEIEMILKRNGVLAVSQMQQKPAQLAGTAFSLHKDIAEVQIRHKAFATDIFKNTPWLKRLKHDASPWKESDKALLESKLASIIYWNQSLYSILPQNIRDSVLRQGISGYILDDEDEAENLSKLGKGPQGRDTALSESANLLAVRRQFKDSMKPGDKLEEKLKKLELKSKCFTDLPTTINKTSQYSIVEYTPDGTEKEIQVLIEWYPFPAKKGDYSYHLLARTRISQLSYLLLPSQKPSTLRTLDSLGFLEHSPIQKFGLVSSFPSLSSPSLQPVTLFDLLSRKPSHAASTISAALFPYPMLEQRYNLAVVLASSLYTFMLVRWHHKRFISTNIAFLFARKSPFTPDLTYPFVGGFALSRPNAPGEISISGPSPEELQVYLHPDLRVKLPQEPPKYTRAYDIYSFGLLLMEIGFWNTLSLITSRKGKSSKLEPRVFREEAVGECKARLGCWMGERYRDVTLRCLNIGNEAEGGIGEGLNDFYWKVVIELIECAPSH